MGKTIGIISLKGGVGKTSSVVSLGSAIADHGKKVLLVDANFSAPNLGLHLDILEPEVTLHHVLNRDFNVKDSIHKLDNFDVIPSAVFKNFNINPFDLRDKLKHLKRTYDFILIDSSPGFPILTVTGLTYIFTNFSIKLLSFPLEYCIAYSKASSKFAIPNSIDA